MKVHELIALLQTFNQDAAVIIDGYEGCGVDDVKSVSSKFIERDVNDEGYLGPHEIRDFGEEVVYLE